jgi:hypothetical protein
MDNAVCYRIADRRRHGWLVIVLVAGLLPGCASKEGPRMAESIPPAADRPAAADGAIAATAMRHFMPETVGPWTRSTYTIPPVRNSVLTGESIVGQYRRGAETAELTFSDTLRLPALTGTAGETVRSVGRMQEVTRGLANGLVVQARAEGVDAAVLRQLLDGLDLAGLAALERKAR